MNVVKRMNPEKFNSEITNEDIRPIQIITIALNAGVIAFLGIVLYFFFTSVRSAETSKDFSYLNIIFFITIAYFPISIIMSRIMSRRILLGKIDTALSSMDMKSSDERNSLAVYRTSHIIKLALLEGSALFGLIIILLSSLSGTLKNSPIYWISLLPMIYFVFSSIISFPTKDRILETLKEAKSEMQLI